MTKLSDILSLSLLARMTDNGYVKAQRHPTLPLRIFNYTAKCQWEREWNGITKKCRGLIVRNDGEVIARPFPKFFNYEEHLQEVNGLLQDGASVTPNPPFDMNEPAIVTDKMDGSLGILYPAERGWAIATRGSFTSDQAIAGTELLHERPEWEPAEDCTYLFEIIYPENRIVVKYDFPELVLLDVIETSTGLRARDSAWAQYRGPVATQFDHATLAEALAEPPRENAEGMVIYFPSTNTRIKLKQADYVALHRIVTGMNEKTVWELLSEGKTADDICQGIPEEFWPWVHETAGDLYDHAKEIYLSASEAYFGICQGLDQGMPEGKYWDRKIFALEAQEPEYAEVRPYLFMLLDNKDLAPSIWKSIKPHNPRSMAAQSEDTA
jgi:RNA ligase